MRGRYFLTFSKFYICIGPSPTAGCSVNLSIGLALLFLVCSLKPTRNMVLLKWNTSKRFFLCHIASIDNAGCNRQPHVSSPVIQDGYCTGTTSWINHRIQLTPAAVPRKKLQRRCTQQSMHLRQWPRTRKVCRKVLITTLHQGFSDRAVLRHVTAPSVNKLPPVVLIYSVNHMFHRPLRKLAPPTVAAETSRRFRRLQRDGSKRKRNHGPPHFRAPLPAA